MAVQHGRVRLCARARARRVPCAEAVESRPFATIGGLWPMMRHVAVTGATRALRCRDWYLSMIDWSSGFMCGPI
eukprot:4934142-Prymnesium_polylepis.1